MFRNLQVYYFIGTWNCSVLYECLYIYNQMKSGTDFCFLFHTDCIHKDQCSRNLLHQALPMSQKCLGSCFLNPLMHLNITQSQTVGHHVVPHPAPHPPSGEAWDLGTKAHSQLLRFLIWWHRITGLLPHWCIEWMRGHHHHHNLCQHGTAVCTLLSRPWKEYINNVKGWVKPSVTVRAALESLRFAFLESSGSHGRC